MMYYLHKVLPVFLSPIFIVIFLVIVGALTSNKKISFLAAALLYLLSTPFVANGVFRYVEGYAVKRPVSEINNAEAIVVLGGMLRSAPTQNGSTTEWNDPDRFVASIELFKAAKAPLLIYTRGYSPWQGNTQIEGEYQRNLAISMGIPDSSIKLTRRVLNTEEEAQSLRQLSILKGSKIILITSAFHMNRAMQIFEQAGFEVDPYPVDFKVDTNTITGFVDFLPSSAYLEYSSIAIREIVGRIYYQTFGKAKEALQKQPN